MLGTILLVDISSSLEWGGMLHIDGLGHKPFKSGQAFFQNDDKNDKTHRAQNV